MKSPNRVLGDFFWCANIISILSLRSSAQIYTLSSLNPAFEIVLLSGSVSVLGPPSGASGLATFQ